MYWGNIFVVLAENLSLSYTDKIRASYYLRECVKSISSLDSKEDGTLISINFLNEVFKIYIYWQKHITLYDPYVRILANKINKFSLENYEGDLTSFVNSLTWTDGCIPYQWALWGDNAGYDTSEWNICS